MKKILMTFTLLILAFTAAFVQTKVQAQSNVNSMGFQRIDGEIIDIDRSQGVVTIQDRNPPNDEKVLIAHPGRLELFNEGNRVRAYYEVRSGIIQNMKQF